MDTATALALLSAGIAAVIAIVVPWLAFHLALRQDHTRWLREQRAEVYVDLLTEAHAEQQWLEFDMADDETRERRVAHFQDLRLPPLERARLGFEPRCSRAGRSTSSSTGCLRRLSGLAV